MKPGETIGVVIGTFGDRERWNRLAARAIASLSAQTRPPDEIARCHAATLAKARNRGAANLRTDWLCFLDADDELAPGYLAAMEKIRGGDILYPATERFQDGRCVEPVSILPPQNLGLRNFIVIGALVKRSLFMEAGMFSEDPIWEDWDLWLRCAYRCGCEIVAVRDAVYKIHIQPQSRNFSLSEPEREEIYKRIRRRYEGVVTRRNKQQGVEA